MQGDSQRIALEDAVDDVVTTTSAVPVNSSAATDAIDAFNVKANDLSEAITDDQLLRTQTDLAQDEIKELYNIKMTTDQISSITEDPLQLNDVEDLQATVTQPKTDPEGPLQHQNELEVEPNATLICSTTCAVTDLSPDESSIKCNSELTGLEDNQLISTASNETFEMTSSDKTSASSVEQKIQQSETSSSCQDNITTVNPMPTDDKISLPQTLQSDTPRSTQDSSSSDSMPHSSDSPLSTTVYPTSNLRSTITGISIAYTRLKLKILKMQLKSTKNRNQTDDLSTSESLAHLSLDPGTTDSEDTGNKASCSVTESEGGTDEFGARQPPPSAKTGVDLTRRTMPKSYQKYSIEYDEGSV